MHNATINPCTLSAINYYVGTSGEFMNGCGKAASSKKAYITINTLMRTVHTSVPYTKTPEYLRFIEGKKQIPDLISKDGLERILELNKRMYHFAEESSVKEFKTYRAGRQNELKDSDGKVQTMTCFQSTTKSTFDDLVRLEYTKKKNLALCTYFIHEGAITLDLEERLGEEYHKPEEREVLVFPGNCQMVKHIGTHPYITGSDGKPAQLFEVHVWGPISSNYFDSVSVDENNLRKIVFDPETIAREYAYFESLNENIGGNFPEEPDGHREWKEAFNELIKLEIKKT